MYLYHPVHGPVELYATESLNVLNKSLNKTRENEDLYCDFCTELVKMNDNQCV